MIYTHILSHELSGRELENNGEEGVHAAVKERILGAEHGAENAR